MKAYTIILVALGFAFSFASAWAQMGGKPKNKDVVDKTLEVIVKTPENIRTIKENQKKEDAMWKEYDKNKPKN